MILNRLGNKTKEAKKLLPLFPEHTIFMELFFGAGGLYFNKPKVKYNFLSDIDADVYNLFRMVIDRKDDLMKMIQTTPIDEKQFKEWGKGRQEEDDIMKAIRFLWISNFGLYGKPSTLRIGALKPREQILRTLDHTFDWLKDAYFFNADFRDFFRKCDYKTNMDKCFAYADPPYLGTDDNYSNSFKEDDSNDLFEVLVNSGVKFGMSEFDHPFILEQAKERNLNVNIVGERTNLKNKRVEILVTNYEIQQQKLIF